MYVGLALLYSFVLPSLVTLSFCVYLCVLCVRYFSCVACIDRARTSCFHGDDARNFDPSPWLAWLPFRDNAKLARVVPTPTTNPFPREKHCLRFVNVRFSLRFVMVSVSDPIADEDSEEMGDVVDEDQDMTTLSYALADVDIM